MRSNRTRYDGNLSDNIIVDMQKFAKKYGYDEAYPALKMSSRNYGYTLQTDYYGYIHVLKNGLWGLCIQDGKVLVPCKYEDVDFVYGNSAMFAMPYKMNGKWGVYSVHKEREGLPCIYDNIYYDEDRFFDSVVCVFNGKEGLFSCAYFRWDIPLKYNSLRPTGDYGIPYPAMIAEIEGKFGIVKSNEEKILLPIEYDEIYKENHIYYAKNGDDIIVLSEQDYPDIYRKEVPSKYFWLD